MSVTPMAVSQSEAPVASLGGIGAERGTQLERLGIRTVSDLLLHGPRRYEDRRNFREIAEIRELGLTAVRGRIVAMGVKRFRRGRRSFFEFILDDGTGRLHCRWWNMPFLAEFYSVGQEWMVFGKVVDCRPRTMDHPETERVDGSDEPAIHLNRIVPIYPLTEGLSQRWLRARIWHLLQEGRLPTELHPRIPRPDLVSFARAVHNLHFPSEMRETTEARRRLAFDEFLDLQVEIQSRRQRLYARAAGFPCAGNNRLMRPFLASLGYPLTGAQTEVLREIRHDLGSGRPMRRLLQGDVGCGKTVVAAAAALMTLESGFSAAIMVPTEILARQHAERFRAWFEPLGIRVAVRTGSLKTDQESGGAEGSAPQLVVGTHALISNAFARNDLGLVVIDEQHKFGVAQRESLLRKGRFPHLLVMTATPIPRTLALTLYGDLDVSRIRELPPGRGTVRTYVRSPKSLEKVWKFLRDQLQAGRQAYVVYPRVDEDQAGEVKAVTRERDRLQEILAPYPVEMLHGRLAGEQKARVMSGFQSGEIKVLLATLVIEVGVDVPNATVMVVENAEQFGLSQLHQLRGRIGRGGHASHCILVSARDDATARARLEVLESTQDGFEIAEADLRLRGPGELLGQTQSGLPRFRFGDLLHDRELIEKARQVASHWLQGANRGIVPNHQAS